MKEVIMEDRNSFREMVSKRKVFFGEEEKPQTIEEVLSIRALEEAREKLNTLNTDISLNAQSIVNKVRPRAASWQIGGLLGPFEDQGEISLESFLEFLKSKETESQSESNIWVVNALGYESRGALRKQISAKKKKEQISQEASVFKSNKLKKEPDNKYGDVFNKLVYELADKLEAENGSPDIDKRRWLAQADRTVREQISRKLSDSDIEDCLADRAKKQLIARLESYFKTGMDKLQDEQKAAVFTSIMFEIDSRKTNETWQGKNKKLEDAVAAGLQGEQLNLTSIFCCINDFDLEGHYNLAPDLFAYQKNAKLEPIPLIIDELVLIARFFNHYGINSHVTIYVSDADYLECHQFGPVTKENLMNLDTYIQNLNDYVGRFDGLVTVVRILQVTSDNPLYQEVKARVYKNVDTFADPKFAKEWNNAFKEAVDKMTESQKKRKFFTLDRVEGESREILKRIWSVNAAQGAFLGSLPGNTVLVSTETKERDQNYVIDRETRDEFVPVLYILQTAKNWTRKLNNRFNIEPED